MVADDEQEAVKVAKSFEERWELAENGFDDCSRAAGKSLPAGQKLGAACAAIFEEEFELAS